MNNQELQEWIKSIDKKLDNHMHEILPKLTEVDTNQKWLMRFFWVIATASIGSLVASVLNLL